MGCQDLVRFFLAHLTLLSLLFLRGWVMYVPPILIFLDFSVYKIFRLIWWNWELGKTYPRIFGFLYT